MTTAAWLLISGFVVFMVGAAGWKTAYEAPVVERLAAMHRDRSRLRTIHSLMLVAMVLTPAGLAAGAAASGQAAIAAAAVAYGLGALLWMLQLTFRLTVQERVAFDVASGAAVPEWFEALERWAALGHRVHMLVSYASAVPLAWGLAQADLIPLWLGWAGAIWGVVWLAGYTFPRIRYVFEPPFWAHLFTFAIGIALL